ncbi:unnamed protein product, partial [Didymodactylos carnosus]
MLETDDSVTDSIIGGGRVRYSHSTGSITSFVPPPPSLDSSSLSPSDNGDNQWEDLIIGSGGKPVVITKIDPDQMTAETIVTGRTPPVLLQEPKYRKYRMSDTLLKQNKVTKKANEVVIYSIIIGIVALIITFWRPMSSYFSGFTVGLMFPSLIAYILFKIYVNHRANERLIREWVEFPELEQLLADKTAKEDKTTTITDTYAEIIFDRYDADNDDRYVRYPCMIHLDNCRLIIRLPEKEITESEKKEQKVKFIGYREYLVNESDLLLVPESTLTRAKYWLPEYPLVIQNLQIIDKQIINRQIMDKTKFDTELFFSNPSTCLSLFFQTGPEKEKWFHKLSLNIQR